MASPIRGSLPYILNLNGDKGSLSYLLNEESSDQQQSNNTTNSTQSDHQPSTKGSLSYLLNEESSDQQQSNYTTNSTQSDHQPPTKGALSYLLNPDQQSNYTTNSTQSDHQPPTKGALSYLLNPDQQSDNTTNSTQSDHRPSNKGSIGYLLGESISNDEEEFHRTYQKTPPQIQKTPVRSLVPRAQYPFTPHRPLPLQLAKKFSQLPNSEYNSLPAQSAPRMKDPEHYQSTLNNIMRRQQVSDEAQPLSAVIERQHARPHVLPLSTPTLGSKQQFPVRLPIARLKRKNPEKQDSTKKGNNTKKPSRTKRKRSEKGEDSSKKIISREEFFDVMKILVDKDFNGIDVLINKYGKRAFTCFYESGQTFAKAGLLNLMVYALYQTNHTENIETLRVNLQKMREKIKENPDAFHSYELELSYSEEEKLIKGFLKEASQRILKSRELKIIFQRAGAYRDKNGLNFLHKLATRLFTSQKSFRIIYLNNYKKVKKLAQKALPQQVEQNTSTQQISPFIFEAKNNEGLNFTEHFDGYLFKKMDSFFGKFRIYYQISRSLFKENGIYMYSFENSLDGKYVKGDSLFHFLIRKLFRCDNYIQLQILLNNVKVVSEVISKNLISKDILDLACHKNSDGEDFYDLFIKLKKDFDEKNQKLPFIAVALKENQVVPSMNILENTDYSNLGGILEKLKNQLK